MRSSRVTSTPVATTPDRPRDAEQLPEPVPVHDATLATAARHTGAMARTAPQAVPFDDAVESTRTGDLWIFRGGTVADRVIQAASNAPVNHVGMALVLDDLPPLMWHAELGRSLRDHWTGEHHRGVQLHDLAEAVTTWQVRYGQRAWVRQLEPGAGSAEEDAALRVVARLDGVSFPSTVRLGWRWLRGRDAHLTRRASERKGVRPEDAYCAEVVAATLEEMGVLRGGVPTNWYDPGRFWSGDTLPLADGWSYRTEVEVARPGG